MDLGARAVRRPAGVDPPTDAADEALTLALKADAAPIDLVRAAAAAERLVVRGHELDRSHEVEASQQLPHLLRGCLGVLDAPLPHKVDGPSPAGRRGHCANPLVDLATLALELDAS